MSATDPIIEQLAIAVQQALKAVTRQNGYHHDVAAVIRPKKLGDIEFKDLLVVMQQGDRRRSEDNDVEGNPSGIAWVQPFEIDCWRMPSDKQDQPIDKLINLFDSDCEKALMQDVQFGGLALFSDIAGVEATISSNGALEGVTINLDCTYRVAENDPYVNRA